MFSQAHGPTGNCVLGGVSRGRQSGQLSIEHQRASAKDFSLLVARVKALRCAVRVDNFRLAQRLRMGLVLYLRHLERPLRNDVARLFAVSGLWVRNVGNRHHTKRNIQRISRRIIQRLHPFVADASSLLVEEAESTSGSGAPTAKPLPTRPVQSKSHHPHLPSSY